MRDGALAMLGAISLGTLLFGGINGIIALVEMVIDRRRQSRRRA